MSGFEPLCGRLLDKKKASDTIKTLTRAIILYTFYQCSSERGSCVNQQAVVLLLLTFCIIITPIVGVCNIVLCLLYVTLCPF